MARALRRGTKKPIWELELLTLAYSGSNAGSRHVRRFVESGQLSEFAESNPQVRIETKHSPGRPFLNARYVSGFTRNIFLGDTKEDDIRGRMEFLRNTCGVKSKFHHRISSGTMRTSHISIQGLWRGKPELWQDPMVNKPLKDEEEAKMRKIFRKVNDELGISGTLFLLQKLKKKELEQVSKIRIQNKDKVNSVARNSLKEYYSQVYVPDVLATEKARAERLKSASKDSPYGPENTDEDEGDDDDDDEEYEWDEEEYGDEDDEDGDDERFDDDEDDENDDDDDDDDWDDDEDDEGESENFERPLNEDDGAVDTFDDDDIEVEEDTAVSDDDEVLDLGEEATKPEKGVPDKKKR
eukprot:Plantae.Rhodophyta-Purpureofilum_apyrenoidigerum.ctg21064.p1 GENE.Plantae.Rhodophyta-Purpureofilum_apyrenoidigerum.ctg21064~~Plantae.Rhodophyta-Purpureofilum_apyrenoidigerum.ctg21064.p1  ORF type:complete len:353 (-),score=102.64 Plantae.Rhodophyta-Purpureofilum_apyrenoidigerum.ctg21064:212-1270(-)